MLAHIFGFLTGLLAGFSICMDRIEERWEIATCQNDTWSCFTGPLNWLSKRTPCIIDLILKEREKHKEHQHLRWERLLKQVCWTIFCFALGFVVAVNVLKSRSLTGVFGRPCS